MKFHKSFNHSYSIFFMALILLIIDRIAEFNLYYVHYILILVGFISIFISYRNFGSINVDGITIFYGPAHFRERLFLPWNEISTISLDSAEVSWIGNHGSFFIPGKMSNTVAALKIVLKNPLPPESQRDIKLTLEKYIFPPAEAINDEGNEIIIREAPYGGFKRFIKKISFVSKIECKES